MTSAIHVALSIAALTFLSRGLSRSEFAASAPDPEVAAAFALALLVASAAGSASMILAGRMAWSPARALVFDAISLAAAAWAFALISLAPWTRELGGVFVVLIAAIRLGPGALAIVSGAAPAWLALVASFGFYAALAAWLPVASLPFGDQVHYLLIADRLRAGTIDATIDPGLFAQLIGSWPSLVDAATHVASAPTGPRPIQGYALPLLILPGWALAGRVGAGIVLALVAAWTSYQMLLILRDLLPTRPRATGWAWLIASACAPLSLLATHIYPNIVGAALIATAFRFGFTAAVPRRALGAGLLALTLLLTPRDAVPFFVLLAVLLRDPLARRGVALATAAVLLVVVAMNAALYGVPLPYAGYLFGTAQAQEITQQSSITPFVWVTLPAILFDRTFGLAGSAPWVFVGLLGLVPALRADRARLVPAAIAVGASIVALSFFRLWEGGYAPPARYFVDVLPLWTPFVAYGLLAVGAAREQASSGQEASEGHRSAPGARDGAGWVVRAAVGVLVALSALTSLILNAVPSLVLNSAFEDKIRGAVARVLGIDPLAWLPSFQPVVPDWYVFAYLTLVPGLAGSAWLVWRGRKSCEAGRGATLNGTPTSSRLAWVRQESTVFLFLNVVLIGWVVAASLQPWVDLWSDPVPASLLRKYLPVALALAAVGTVAIAPSLEPDRRAAFLGRHFWLYAVPLALMLVAAFRGNGLVSGQFGAIYLLIAMAFPVNALVALWPALDRLTDRGVALRLAGVALGAMVVLLPYHRAVMPTASDEPHYLLVTQSLLYDGDLDVRNDYEGDRYFAFYPTRLPDMHAVEVGRAAFSIRDPALPLLSVVPFAIGGRLGVLALMCVVGAALVAQLYLLLRDLRFAPRVAFLATATTALAHPIYTYTTQVYPELLAVLAFASAVRVLRAGTRAAIPQLAIASALVGALPWLSTRAWPTVVGVGLVIAYCAIRPALSGPRPVLAARVVAGAAPFTAFVLALAFLNWRTFGLFMPSAGYFLIREGQQVLTYTPWIGAPGLLFDRVFGLIPRAPIYLLAFVGLVPLWRRGREHRVQVAALALGSLLLFIYIADIHYWWADGSPPSRYALGSVPLLIAAVAGGWEIALGRAWTRALAATSVVASAAVAYVYAVLPNIRYDLALDVRASASSGALFDFLARATGVDAGLAFPSLVRGDPISVALTAVWTLIAAALVWFGARKQAAVVNSTHQGLSAHQRTGSDAGGLPIRPGTR